MSEWFCHVDGIESGPLSIDELRFLKARGKLERDSLVRSASESTCKPAISVPGLFSDRRSAKGQGANGVQPEVVGSDGQDEAANVEDTTPPAPAQQAEPEADAAPMRPPPRKPFERSLRRGRKSPTALIGGSLLVLLLLLLVVLSWLAGTMSRQLPSGGGDSGTADYGSDIGSPGATNSRTASDQTPDRSDSGETPAVADGDSAKAEAPSNDEHDGVEDTSDGLSSVAPDGEGTGATDDAPHLPKMKVIASLPAPGQRSSGRGGGDGRSSQFFGVSSQGQSFVYIVDRSGSMSGGRFDRAKTELIEAIRSLQPHQAFYVYFFTTYPMPIDHPAAPTPQLIAASDNNVAEFESWISGMSAAGGSSGGPATITEALRLEPDAIFFLSDGDLPYDTADLIRNQNVRPTIPIHTIGFEDRSGEALLRQVADDSEGKYRFVP